MNKQFFFYSAKLIFYHVQWMDINKLLKKDKMISLGDKIEESNSHWARNYNDDSYDNLYLRNKFITRVYSILGGQLLVTIAFVLLSMNYLPFALFQLENRQLFWAALVISMISLTIFGCFPGMSTNYPLNWILFSIFTLSESYLVSFICILYSPDVVLNAAMATLAATLGLTLYAVKSKKDFSDSYSKCWGFLWSFFFVGMFLVVLNVFFIRCEGLSLIIAIAFSGLYSFYLIIDTQLIMGDRKYQMKLDNYLMGATLLYANIVGLFLNLLRILNRFG